MQLITSVSTMPTLWPLLSLSHRVWVPFIEVVVIMLIASTILTEAPPQA